MKGVWKGFMNLFDKADKSNSADSSNEASTTVNHNQQPSHSLLSQEATSANYLLDPVPFEKILWKNTDSTLLPKIAEFGKNFTNYIKQTIDNNILTSDTKNEVDEKNDYDDIQNQFQSFGVANDFQPTGISVKRKRTEIDDDDYLESLQPYEENMLKLLKYSPSSNKAYTVNQQYAKLNTKNSVKNSIDCYTNFNISNQREVYNFGKNRPTNSYGLPSAYVALYNDSTVDNEIPTSFETLRRLKKRYMIGVNSNLDIPYVSKRDKKVICENHEYAQVGKVKITKRKHHHCHRCCKGHYKCHHSTKSYKHSRRSHSCHNCRLGQDSKKMEPKADIEKTIQPVAVEHETNKIKLVDFSVQAGDSMLESSDNDISVPTTNETKMQSSGETLINKICQQPLVDLNKTNDYAHLESNVGSFTPIINTNDKLLSPKDSVNVVANTNTSSDTLVDKPSLIVRDFNFSSTDGNINEKVRSDTRNNVVHTTLPLLNTLSSLSSSNKQPLTTNKLNADGELGVETKSTDFLDQPKELTNVGVNTASTIVSNQSDQIEVSKELPFSLISPSKFSISSDESPKKSTISEFPPISVTPIQNVIPSSESSSLSATSNFLKAASDSNSAFDRHNLFKSTDSNETTPKTFFKFNQNKINLETPVSIGKLSDKDSEHKTFDSNLMFDKSSPFKFGSDSTSISSNLTELKVAPNSGVPLTTNIDKDNETAGTNTLQTNNKLDTPIEIKWGGSKSLGFDSTSFSTKAQSQPDSSFWPNINTTQVVNNSASLAFGFASPNAPFKTPNLSNTSFATANSSEIFNTSSITSQDPIKFISSVENSSFGAAQPTNTMFSLPNNSTSFTSGFGSTTTNPFNLNTTENTGFMFSPTSTKFGINGNEAPSNIESANNAFTSPQTKPFSFQTANSSSGFNFNFSSGQPVFSDSPQFNGRPVSAGSTSFSFSNPTSSAPKFGSSSELSDTPAMAFMKRRALRQKRNR